MTDNQQYSENLKHLQETFDRINDWLKFAETKNGVLLAFNCAVLVGLFQVLSSLNNPPILASAYLILSISMLGFGITLTLMSFLPRLTPPLGLKFPAVTPNMNILFFGHICSLTENSYLDRFYSVYELERKYIEIEKIYANQIIINSKITFIKFCYFNLSVKFTISALITPLGTWIIYNFKKK